MKTLNIIAAVLYAVTLWLFAPQKIWDSEVKKAKAKFNKPAFVPLPQEKPTPLLTKESTPEKEPDTQPETAKPLIDTVKPDTKTPKATNWTVKKLRKMAQQQKLNWRDENGKPLKKNELMRILAV